LPERKTNHPLRCHKPRIPDRMVFGKLVEVSVRPDGTLEVHGILGESLRFGPENGRAVCTPELGPWCTTKPANHVALAFRAELSTNGAERLELVRA
jgi:hypothetical protein